MTVDLTTGNKGLVKFRNGQLLWVVCILQDGELYRIRLDTGKYHEVGADGKVKPNEESPYDVVEFDPTMKWLTAMQRFIPTEITLR